MVPSAVQAQSSPSNEVRASMAPTLRTLDFSHDHVMSNRMLEVGGRTFRHQPSRRDDADTVCQGVGFVEVLRRQEDGHPEFRVEPSDLRPHRHPAVRVETGCRLVKKEHLGVVDEGGGEVKTTLHSSRVGSDSTVDGGSDVNQIEDLAESVPDLCRVQAVEPPLERQQLAPGLAVVDRCILQCDADA